MKLAYPKYTKQGPLYTVKNNFQRANDNFAYIKFMLLLVKISMSSTILVLESDLMQGKIPKQMQV